MSHRYSRAEKEKWVERYGTTTGKPRVKIPQCDNSGLIRNNKFTLIGRVTNPAIQKTKALVEFFIDHWHVSGTITGSDLGPNLFQFRFENEQDLQAILNKAPFHFKKWMLILQRWEPIVSETFPALIPFWIKIHGIPLHFWSDHTIRTIGFGLGHFEARDVEKGRIRVHVNGLKPLEMKMDIELPTGEVKEVEFEYENLEKHCFSCLSLSHEKKDCPLQLSTRDNNPIHLGISQRSTLDRLEANKKRQEERKGRRYPHRTSPARDRRGSNRDYINSLAHSSYSGRALSRDTRYHEASRRDSYKDYSRHHHEGVERRRAHPYRSSHSSLSRHTNPVHGKSLENSFESHNQDTTNRSSGRNGGAISKNTQAHSHQAHSHQSHHSQVSHTPPPRPQREPFRTPPQAETGPGSEPERRSVLERLSLPYHKGHTHSLGELNTTSDRLQDIEIRYMGEATQVHRSGNSDLPSSPRHPRSALEDTLARSPIRSLSEDRLHVSLRLGPLRTSTTSSDIPTGGRKQKEKSKTTSLPKTTATKRAGGKTAAVKRTTNKVATNKRGLRSPLQGVSLKKTRITRAKCSPRRKLNVETSAMGSNLPCDKDRNVSLPENGPQINVIPAISRRVVDFRSPPNTLP
ncbi:unnamed protein product [Microthlaspi erraticum]|uniref:DUF4283 domain-containing protein n=1 Tax=Microthlaspi erraticum TaxID=1685480 RepID=A0A6D2HLJ8_9BRAS|nr:unnamed protein product [Microthlaspi erraticum]